MGAWGHGIFDNDDACDYAAAIAESNDLSIIEKTLDRVLETGPEYLEAPDASEALAAADIIARLKGVYGEKNAYTETIDAWVARTKITPGPELLDKARRSIDRITTEPSELMELWKESADYSRWKLSLEQLVQRING